MNKSVQIAWTENEILPSKLLLLSPRNVLSWSCSSTSAQKNDKPYIANQILEKKVEWETDQFKPGVVCIMLDKELGYLKV